MDLESEEKLYARVARAAQNSGKRFAIMRRSAWGERVGIPFSGNNSVEFLGKLIIGDTSHKDDGKIVPIGFYHPIFCGFIGKLGVVEVIDNLSTHAPVRYIARGQGLQQISGSRICIGMSEWNPCEPTECTGGYYIGLGGPAALGSDESFAFYDRDTMDHDIGINEIPARLKLRGYSGEIERPRWGVNGAFNATPLFTWSPGVSAFDLSFQSCGQHAGGPTTNGIDCCKLAKYLIDFYGDDVFDHIDDESGEGVVFGDLVRMSCLNTFIWFRDHPDG